MALLIVIFVVMDYVEYVDDFMDRGATTAQVFGTYYLHYVPEIVRLTSPLAVFLAAVYVTARFAQSMQLTALQMAGVSLWRYMRPMLFAGVVITIGMLLFNGFVVPRANQTVLAFQNEYYRDSPDDPVGSEIYRQAGPHTTLSVGFFDREEQRAFRVSLVTTDDTGRAERLQRRVDASDMVWVDSLRKWRLGDVTVTDFPSHTDAFPTTRRLAEMDTSLALGPADLAQSARRVDQLTIPEARRYVESLEKAGVTERGRPLVAYHTKYAYPLANLLLILVGVPMAARRRRGGQAAQLALGLGVAFLYLALQKTLEPLGYVQDVPPLFAAWLPHLVFALVGALLLWRAHR